jgi:RNA polymerase sigma factor (sigma-70 family)
MQHRPFPFAGATASIAGMPAERQEFAAVLEDHRAELQRHCTRLLGSPTDAEDALQEALLRAWRSRHTLASDAPRAWLYRIATNACLDLAARRGPALAPLEDEPAFAAPCEQRPDAIVLNRETVELALLTAVQQLPPRQHASLVMRDALSCSASETATALATSVAATNSALQRARQAMRSRLATDRLDWACAPASPSQRRALRVYLTALEAG